MSRSVPGHRNPLLTNTGSSLFTSSDEVQNTLPRKRSKEPNSFNSEVCSVSKGIWPPWRSELGLGTWNRHHTSPRTQSSMEALGCVGRGSQMQADGRRGGTVGGAPEDMGSSPTSATGTPCSQHLPWAPLVSEKTQVLLLASEYQFTLAAWPLGPGRSGFKPWPCDLPAQGPVSSLLWMPRSCSESGNCSSIPGELF